MAGRTGGEHSEGPVGIEEALAGAGDAAATTGGDADVLVAGPQAGDWTAEVLLCDAGLLDVP